MIIVEPEDGWLDLHAWRLLNLNQGKAKYDHKTVQRWIQQFQQRPDAVRGLTRLADTAGIARASFGTAGAATFIIDRQGTVRFGRRTLGDEDRATADELLYVLDELQKKRSLIEGLSHARSPLGRLAERILTNRSKLSKTAVTHLTTALTHHDAKIRAGAAAASWWIAPQAPAIASKLIVALDDKDPEVRRLSAEALWLIKPDAKAVVPAILRVTANNRGYYRSLVVARLRRVGTAALPGFLDALTHPDPRLRAQAAGSLWRFKWGEQFYPVSSTKIVRALVPLVGDSDARVRKAAADGISGLRHDWILEEASRVLGQAHFSKKSVRTAIEQTYQVLADHQTFEPALRRATKDIDRNVRKAAARVLDGMADTIKAADSLAPVYLLAMKDTNGPIRDKAAYIAQVFGGKQVGAALPAVRTALAIQDDMAREEQFAAALLPLLLVRLEHKSFFHRASAAWAIGRLGHLAKPARGPLRRALEDESEDVRWAAAQAIKRIEYAAGNRPNNP